MTFSCCWDKGTIETHNTDKLTAVLMTSGSKLYYPVFSVEFISSTLTDISGIRIVFFFWLHCFTDGKSSL